MNNKNPPPSKEACDYQQEKINQLLEFIQALNDHGQSMKDEAARGEITEKQLEEVLHILAEERGSAEKKLLLFKEQLAGMLTISKQKRATKINPGKELKKRSRQKKLTP